jgi:hypothetical protein
MSSPRRQGLSFTPNKRVRGRAASESGPRARAARRQQFGVSQRPWLLAHRLAWSAIIDQVALFLLVDLDGAEAASALLAPWALAHRIPPEGQWLARAGPSFCSDEQDSIATRRN